MAALPALAGAEVVGEVALDPDGVLHGWCWSPARPDARLTIDICVGDVVAATVVASRFREDVRNRKFGDGYHGFTITLTKQLSKSPGVISARERGSGRVFWQKLVGETALPAGFDERLARVEAAICGCADAMPAPGPGRTDMLAAGIGEAGRRLRGRPGADPGDVPVRLGHAASPRFSLILEAGADAARTEVIVTAAARAIGEANAELILVDDGADPQMVYLAARIGDLRYFYEPRGKVALRRNLGAEFARGGILVFLNNTGRRFDAGLAELAGVPALEASAVLPPLAARLAGYGVRAGTQPPLGLALAIGREVFTALGGFDEAVDDGFAVADLAARMPLGVQMLVWNEAGGADTFAAYADGYLPLV
jgi:hypothetical protein